MGSIFLKTVPGAADARARLRQRDLRRARRLVRDVDPVPVLRLRDPVDGGGAGGTGGQVTENTPLLPTLSPLQLYKKLFSGLMPGGGTGSVNDMAKLLKARKSVLDYSLSELARMRTLAPGRRGGVEDRRARRRRSARSRCS